MSDRPDFKQAEVEDLLKKCHRRCCVCHRFCGVKIEVDHIVPASEGGTGEIANAIPLCFECHAEVHHYNPRHPKGRRFSGAELRGHRDQWLGLCDTRPDIFVHAMPAPEAGSLERLLSELEFNLILSEGMRVGAAFELVQFRRAIADGTFAWIDDTLRVSIGSAYQAIVLANADVESFTHRHFSESSLQGSIKASAVPIRLAIENLRGALLS